MEKNGILRPDVLVPLPERAVPPSTEPAADSGLPRSWENLCLAAIPQPNTGQVIPPPRQEFPPVPGDNSMGAEESKKELFD